MADPSLVDHVRAMALNNAWSNHRLYDACAGLSDADLKAKRTSFFPSIHLTLNHNLEVDRRYLDRLDGRDVPVESDHELLDFTQLAEAQRAEDRRLIAYCDRLDVKTIDGEVPIRREDGIWMNRVADVLAHLFVHQIHHRGQVHAMLAGTAVPPPQLDEFFLGIDRGDDIDEALASGKS